MIWDFAHRSAAAHMAFRALREAALAKTGPQQESLPAASVNRAEKRRVSRSLQENRERQGLPAGSELNSNGRATS